MFLSSDDGAAAATAADEPSEGKESPVPGLNGLILNAIFDALYKSSETGREELVDVSY